MRILYCCFLIFFCSVSAYPLDVLFNGSLYHEWPDEELRSFSYITKNTEPPVRGICFHEIAPPCIECWNCSVKTKTEEFFFTSDDLTDQFPEWYIEETAPGAWQLRTGDTCLSDIRSISIQGEAVSDRSLEVWISWEGIPELKKEIRRYAELHNLTIKATDVPQADSKLLAVLRGRGVPPDIIMVQSSDIAGLVSAGAVQRLDYFTTRDLLTQGKEAFTVGKKLWALPFYFDSQILLYNKNIIQLPEDMNWTLQNLEKHAQSIEGKDIIPLSWNAYSTNWLIPFQISFGKIPLINRDGTITINDQPTEKALNYILSLMDRKLLKPLERDAMISLFASGKIGMILAGSYNIPELEKLNINFGVLSFPFNQQTGRPVSPLLDFKAFAVTRRSRNTILAKRLLQYLTGIGVQQRFPPSLAKMPAETGAWEISEKLNPYWEALNKSSVRGTVIPPERAYGVYKNVMWKLLRFALSGQMQAEKVLTEGQRIVNKQMESNIYP